MSKTIHFICEYSKKGFCKHSDGKAGCNDPEEGKISFLLCSRFEPSWRYKRLKKKKRP